MYVVDALKYRRTCEMVEYELHSWIISYYKWSRRCFYKLTASIHSNTKTQHEKRPHLVNRTAPTNVLTKTTSFSNPEARMSGRGLTQHLKTSRIIINLLFERSTFIWPLVTQAPMRQWSLKFKHEHYSAWSLDIEFWALCFKEIKIKTRCNSIFRP